MNYHFSALMGRQSDSVEKLLKNTNDPSLIPFSGGNPASETFPVADLSALCGKIFAEEPEAALQYSYSVGYPPLRQTVRQWVKERWGVGRESDDVLITTGSQQGMILTARALCDPGDVVLAEEYSFLGALNSFRSCGAETVGVAMEPDGLSVEDLERQLKAHPNARFLYTIPNFQNPTGVTLSAEKRRAIYRLACQYDIVILEDDPYGELRFRGEDLPAIKSMDTEGRVIYCGSFSKVVAPGLRVAYLVADRELITRMSRDKAGDDVHTAVLPQILCHRVVTETDFGAHLKALKKVYERKARLMMECMDRAVVDAGVTYLPVDGGLFLWCTLPEGTDMVDYCDRLAREARVAVVPGSAFASNEGTPCRSFRMNYSTPADEDIVRGCEQMGAFTRSYLKK